MKADGRVRGNIARGVEVLVVLKRDQRTGKLTQGKVKDILTRSKNHPRGIKVVKAILTRSRKHPRGIKVRLEDGRIGRVQEIVALKKGENL